MDRVKILLLLLAVALVSAGVPLAHGSSSALPQRVTALEKKVATLQKTVTNLAGQASCLNQIAPLTSYGQGANEGYHYKNADGTESLVSAADFTGQGDTPNFVAVGIDPKCLTQALRARAGGRAAWHTATYVRVRHAAR